MYPELWLHEFARERQREILLCAARRARSGIGEEPSAPKRLPWPFRWRLKAGESLAAVGSESGGKLGPRRDLELAVTAAQVVRDRLAGDEQGLRDLAVGPSLSGLPGNPELRGRKGVDAP